MVAADKVNFIPVITKGRLWKHSGIEACHFWLYLNGAVVKRWRSEDGYGGK